MAQAARVVSVSMGKDPRDYAFIPFGGAGPVHGARLARMLGCQRIVFPHGAGVASAIGLLLAEPAFDLARTRITALDAKALATINATFRDLEARGRRQLAACGIRAGGRYRRSADMRFVGQGYEIGVDLPEGPYAAGDVERLRAAFFDAYAAMYGDRAFNRADAIELVHYRVTAASPVAAMAMKPVAAGGSDGRHALKGRRPAWFPETAGFVDCAVYDRYALRSGDRFEGPALVEERESTVVIIPGSRAQVDGEGNIVADLDPSTEAP
jgi:N-methylhydantoinase A